MIPCAKELRDFESKVVIKCEKCANLVLFIEEKQVVGIEPILEQTVVN